jgi:hypothetical protein
MSATLARKLRRIGLTRTFSTTQQTVITTDEQGNETEGIVTNTTSERHRTQYSPEELAVKRAAIIAEWRARRKRR